MAMPRRDPSGPGTAITIRLSPRHLAILDRRRGRAGRGPYLARLLERDEPRQAPAPPRDPAPDDAAPPPAEVRKAAEAAAARARIVRGKCPVYLHGHVARADGTCKGCGARLTG